MNDYFIPLFAIIFAIFLFSLQVFGSYQKCTHKYSDYHPEWSIFGGCRVEWDGKMTPVENIGLREINN